MNDNHPLESLAAFAISFAAGLLSAAALVGYRCLVLGVRYRRLVDLHGIDLVQDAQGAD